MAQTAYGTGRAGGDDYATLYTIDTTTGVWTNKVQMFGAGQDNETANPFNIALASNGAVWVSGRSGGDDYTSIYQIDPVTGAFVTKKQLFSMGQDNETTNAIDIAFAPDGGLWGVGRAGGDDYATLYEIDLSTGVWTNKITLFGMGQDNETQNPFDIAFAPDGGLWLAGRSGGDDYTSVYKIDPLTGMYTTKTSLFGMGQDNETNVPMDLAFASDGAMWLSGRSGGDDYTSLYKINPQTGTYLTKVLLFSMGQDNETTHPIDIAFPAVLASPGAVPEPSTWALLILGFGAAGSVIRRRRATAHPYTRLPA